MSEQSLFKKGERVVLIALLVNFSVSLAKLIVGHFSKSVALVADAFHSFGDCLANLASLVGIKIASRKPSERFPYGYYKAESLAAFFISLFLLYAGFELLVESYSRFLFPRKIELVELAGIAAIASSVIAFLISRYEEKAGRSLNLLSLSALASESKLDVFTSLLVLLAIVASHFNLPILEPLVGFLISLFIVKTALSNACQAICALLDVSPGREIEEKVISTISSISGVRAVENLRLRSSGPFIFGEVIVKVGEKLDVKRAHEIADLVEARAKSEVPQLLALTVHVEPEEIEKRRVAIPLLENKGRKSKVASKFGRAKYFALVDVDLKERLIERVEIIRNPHAREVLHAGLKTARFLTARKIDAVITKEIGEIAFSVLRANLIEVYKCEGRMLGSVISAFLKGKLKELRKPTKRERIPIEELPGYLRPWSRGYRARRRWGWRE